jgi:hypothetical protein
MWSIPLRFKKKKKKKKKILFCQKPTIYIQGVNCLIENIWVKINLILNLKGEICIKINK